MYGKRRRSKRPATELTDERREDLIGNYHGLVGSPHDVFRTVEERKQCWLANRERLMFVLNSGCRPDAWWAFESPVPPDLHRSQDEQLYRLGELTKKEIEVFETWWTRHGRSLDEVPPADYRAPDPRTLPSE